MFPPVGAGSPRRANQSVSLPSAPIPNLDHPEWTFELKFDGFRGIADTIAGRMLSKHGNRMRRFEGLLAALSDGCIFDGEIITPDGAGRPIFADLMLGGGVRCAGGRRPGLAITAAGAAEDGIEAAGQGSPALDRGH
jgi:hypothetical protein